MRDGPPGLSERLGHKRQGRDGNGPAAFLVVLEASWAARGKKPQKDFKSNVHIKNKLRKQIQLLKG